jgi:hypothetical protein
MSVTGCTISQNSANGYPSAFGGGINAQGTLSVTGCTISQNSASSSGFEGSFGGGIYGTLKLDSSIVAGNTATTDPDISGTVTSLGYNLVQSKGNSTGYIPSGNNKDQLNVDPLLSTLGNYGGPTQTCALLPGSPAIDHGDDSLNTQGATDQRGQQRSFGSHVDVGAFESQGYTLTAVDGTPQTVATNADFPSQLQAKLTENGFHSPVPGVTITFSGLGSGASITTSPSASTGTDGIASVSVTANGTAGAYTVSAKATAVAGSASFSLTNIGLVSIAVTPANPSIAQGHTQQFTATGTYSDGSTQDLTATVTWASATTSVATISSAGLATGVGGGTSTISATQSGVSGSTVLTVVSWSQATSNLVAQVGGTGLSASLQNYLDTPLQSALTYFNTGDNSDAVSQLKVFISRVSALSQDKLGRQLTAAQTSALIASAQAIINAVG